MSVAAINQSISSTSLPQQGLANWLVSKSGEHSLASKIEYHLVGRVALAGASLLSLIEAVGRAVMGCAAFVGYLMTLGCWQQAKDFAAEQIRKRGPCWIN